MSHSIHILGGRNSTFDSTLESLRADSLWHHLNEQISEAGFRYWSYTAAPTCPTLPTDSARVTTYPRGHVKECVDHHLLAHCPGLAFAFRQARPALFKAVRASTPMTRQFGALLKLNREFGVTRGVVVPLRGVFGFTGMVALEFEGTDSALLDLWHENRESLMRKIAYYNEHILTHHARCFTRDALPALSQRQRKTVRLLAQGLSTQDLADALHISIDTVNKHTAALKRRLGTKTTAQTTALAARWGLI
jgi:DNA-binding CsgD family transcriptional regulator